jgi:hypothetical protein
MYNTHRNSINSFKSARSTNSFKTARSTNSNVMIPEVESKNAIVPNDPVKATYEDVINYLVALRPIFQDLEPSTNTNLIHGYLSWLKYVRPSVMKRVYDNPDFGAEIKQYIPQPARSNLKELVWTAYDDAISHGEKINSLVSKANRLNTTRKFQKVLPASKTPKRWFLSRRNRRTR